MKKIHIQKYLYVSQIFLLLSIGPFVETGQSGELTETNWGQEYAGSKLSLSLEKRGDSYMYPVYAVLVLSNTTDQVLQTVRTPIKNSYKILVTDSEGTPIPLTRYGQQKMHDNFNTKVQPLGIQPGKVFTERILLNRWYDLTVKGSYSVEVSRIVADPVVKGWTYVTSNIVQLDIP